MKLLGQQVCNAQGAELQNILATSCSPDGLIENVSTFVCSSICVGHTPVQGAPAK
jgi:hypothetical protein